MAGKIKHKRYRIGDFAKFMGVTPDFLKHYEECGLLKVDHSPSGYRYYNFDQSSRILDYMRLRNYGVTLKEMAPMLSADAEEAVRLLDLKVDEMRRHAERMLAVIEEHKRLQAWQARRRQKPVDWEVRNMQAHYFLPHSVLDDFIRDERIGALLKSWMEWLPVAKSGLHVLATPQGGQTPYTSWGVILPEDIALRYDIPMNDVVRKIPASKALVYHFLAEEPAFSMDLIARGVHPAFDLAERLGLKLGRELYLIVEMKFIKPDGSRRGGYGRFVLPLAQP